MSPEAPVIVSHNVPEQRYEAHLGESLAGFVTYESAPEGIVITHTVVEPAFEGRGIGGLLVKRALDEARAHGRSVTPLCSFAAAFIDRHPEYADLLARGEQVTESGGSGI